MISLRQATPAIANQTTIDKSQFKTVLRLVCASAVMHATGCAVDRAAVVPILMYHHVQDLPPNADEGMRTWTVSEKDFRRQMQYIDQHAYHTISFVHLL